MNILQNMYKKAIELNGKDVLIENKSTKALVKFKNNKIVANDLIAHVDDELLFIVALALNVNDIIVFKNKQYKITSVDDTVDGYYTYYTKYYNVAIVYSIEATETTLNINVGDTSQINVICRENQVVVENPSVNYTSSDETIATVSQDGVVTGVSEGSCKIICNYFSASCEVNINTIKEEIPLPSNYEIQGEDNIRVNNSYTYTLEPKVGNTSWYLDEYAVEDNLAQLNIINDYEVTVKGLKYGEFFELHCSCGNELDVAKEIMINR